MKKKIGNILLVLAVVAFGLVACSDAQDIEPIDIESVLDGEIQDKLEDRPDTGDIVG